MTALPGSSGRIKGATNQAGQPVIVVILVVMARAARPASIAGIAVDKERVRGADIMRAIVVAIGDAVTKNRTGNGQKNNGLIEKQRFECMNRRF
ncbi:MAG: hypothetical protein ACN6O3_19640 [Comamonas sp.]